MRRRIFINYRRDDSSAYAGWLYERLLARFPNWVFRDITSLEPGVRWNDAITRAISEVNVCIVVIGKHWLTVTDVAGNRRLDNPDDTVRQEIVAALQHNAKIIPVLVGGASMPSKDDLPFDLHPLCDWQAIEMAEQNWDDCCRKLIRGIEDALGVPHISEQNSHKRPKVPLIASLSALAALAIAGGIFAIVRAPANESHGGTPNTTTIAPPNRDGAKRAENGSARTGVSTNPAEVPAAPAPAPILSDTSAIGSWNAVIILLGQRYDNQINLYADQSFGMKHAELASAVGSWQANPAEGNLEFTRATNFGSNGLKFSCQLRADANAGDAYSGACVDQLNRSAMITLAHKSPTPETVPEIPRIDTSALTMGERSVFAAFLAVQPCTCGCRYLTLLRCLREDARCPYSPGASAAALSNFLAMTRS